MKPKVSYRVGETLGIKDAFLVGFCVALPLLRLHNALASLLKPSLKLSKLFLRIEHRLLAIGSISRKNGGLI
jgi:hypothetical protein